MKKEGVSVIVGNWLTDAQETYAAALFNFKGKHLKVAAYLSQQAAEKALKAIYIKMNGELLRTHDVQLLAKKIGAEADIAKKGALLNPLYTESRYPDFEEGITAYTPEEVQEALNNAAEVIAWAKKKI